MDQRSRDVAAVVTGAQPSWLALAVQAAAARPMRRLLDWHQLRRCRGGEYCHQRGRGRIAEGGSCTFI
jgi:hypothetical protein